MKIILHLSWAALLMGCATHHAARISCDSNLRPINAPAQAAAGPLADTVKTKAMDGAP
jgi:hypothetical protein